MRLTTRGIIVVFALEGLAFAFLTFALLDRRAHQRDPTYGVNQWGYRDEARGSKEPGEVRVAVVGGSSAFEAGLDAGGTLAGTLYIELRAAGAQAGQLYSVVNLSEPRAGPDSYVESLRAYAFLAPDIVCVFDGYDSQGGVPPHGRQRSIVFRAAGYLPILPSRILGRPAWLSDPDGGIGELLRDTTNDTVDVSCTGASRASCEAMADTVRFALGRGLAVVVVAPPSVSARHARQQQSLAARLAREFSGDERFKQIDMGAALDLADPELSPDHVRRTPIGNHVIGQKIAVAILRWWPALASKR